MNKVASLMIVLVGIGFLSAQEMELKGEIVEIEEIVSPEGDFNILEVKMRIDEKEMVKAHLSPAWYLDTELKVGDEIMLKGQYDEKNQFKAREIMYPWKMELIPLKIRNEAYEPLWLKTRIQEESPIYNPKKEKHMKGRIVELYVDQPSAVMEAIVETEDGQVFKARIAPERYLKNQIRVGDDLELKGSEVKSQEGMLILTREIKNIRTQKEIILRNAEGFPEWIEEGEEVKQQLDEPVPEE